MRLFWLVAGLAAAVLHAGEPKPAEYRLHFRDLVHVAVNGEGDAAVDWRIDRQGGVLLPMLGLVRIGGLTVAEAQALVTRRYVEQEIFIHPEVIVSVVEYSPREVMVLGQVGKQGKVAFPPETEQMSIVELVTTVGGFTRIAKTDDVRVTRQDENGREQTITVNVSQMIDGHRGRADAFQVQPGDVVYVPERVF